MASVGSVQSLSSQSQFQSCKTKPCLRIGLTAGYRRFGQFSDDNSNQHIDNMEETAMFVKKEEGVIKSEGDTADENFGPCPLWKGKILLQQERSQSLRVAVQIFHQDDSKGTLQLFDWTHGTNTNDETTLHECFPFSGVSLVTIQKYPMAVLGGKSKPSMKKLKPYIKVGLAASML